MELLYDMLTEEWKDILSAAVRIVVEEVNIDYVELIELKSMMTLEKIKTVIENDSLSDFECIERIVKIFEQIGSNAGNRHDF